MCATQCVLGISHVQLRHTCFLMIFFLTYSPGYMHWDSNHRPLNWESTVLPFGYQRTLSRFVLMHHILKMSYWSKLYYSWKKFLVKLAIKKVVTVYFMVDVTFYIITIRTIVPLGQTTWVSKKKVLIPWIRVKVTAPCFFM